MSAQVCPVCGGKGLVPNGFYDVDSSNLSNYRQKTTSASPETCRSCGGKGYIIEFPDTYQHPVYNVCKSCSICNKNDEMCYTSNPPQYRCTLDGKFHDGHYSCDKFDNTPTYRTIQGKVVEDFNLTLNSTPTSDNTVKVRNEDSTETNSCDKGVLGCFTCANNDHRTYVSVDDDYICTDKYRCTLDGKQYSRHHYCSEYKYDHSGDFFESDK